MLVEAAAEHLAELRPGEERRRRRMRRHEPFAVVLDEREQVGALLAATRSISRTPKKKIASK